MKRQRRRRGAQIIEFAIVLPVFLILVLGMVDLAICVLRSHVLSQAARSGARAAIVRGEYADALGKLGPTTITSTADGENDIAEAVKSRLVTLDAADVDVTAVWIDGSNRVEDRVRVTVSTSYQPMLTYVFGSPTWTQQASSTMPIAH